MGIVLEGIGTYLPERIVTNPNPRRPGNQSDRCKRRHWEQPQRGHRENPPPGQALAEPIEASPHQPPHRVSVDPPSDHVPQRCIQTQSDSRESDPLQQPKSQNAQHGQQCGGERKHGGQQVRKKQQERTIVTNLR